MIIYTLRRLKVQIKKIEEKHLLKKEPNMSCLHTSRSFSWLLVIIIILIVITSLRNVRIWRRCWHLLYVVCFFFFFYSAIGLSFKFSFSLLADRSLRTTTTTTTTKAKNKNNNESARKRIINTHFYLFDMVYFSTSTRGHLSIIYTYIAFSPHLCLCYALSFRQYSNNKHTHTNLSNSILHIYI